MAAEARAACLLEQAGFTVMARNYRCRAGELDIIARRAELLVIAEVRLRSRAEFGGAAASITRSKRARIVRATRYLLRCQPALAQLAVRFDALVLSAPDGPIEWIEAAFEAS
jgi:putative endonuclease